MAEILENAAHLAESIGPRPAGTEEERQAALFINEALQRKAGLPAEVEDFTCPTDFELPRAIYCLVAVVLTILTFFLPVLIVIAFVATLAVAALFAVETLVKPILATATSRGESQNVVARYEAAPKAGAQAARQRKVVLVAHYDTGKVRSELSPALIPLLPIVYWAELGAVALLALLLLIRLASSPTGGLAVVITVLTVIACVLALLPVAALIVHRLAGYAPGANCNASGVAVMIEVAQRLRKGREHAREMEAMEVRIHGEQAAREGGLVPEGATLSYAQGSEPELTAEERLMSAKAAVAMLTGRPVSATVNIDLDEGTPEQIALAQDADGLLAEEERLRADAAIMEDAAAEMGAGIAPANAVDSVDEQPVTFSLGTEDAEAPAAEPAPARPTAAEPAPMPTYPAFIQEPDDSLPDWFKAARAKARKSVGSSMPVTRSRYAEAADTAREAIDQRHAQIEAEQAAEAERQNMTETEQRLASIRDSIMEVQAPRAHVELTEEAAVAGAEEAAAEEATVREEVSTVAFAPVEINGEELKREAARQKREGAQAEAAQPQAAQASAVEAAPEAAAPEATSAAAPEAASAPSADEAAAARLDNLRKSIPLVGKKPTSEEQKARQDALRQVLPSLSGSIKVSPDLFAKKEEPAAPAEKTDAFAPVSATRAFEPVTEVDMDEVDAEDIIEDADDSSYDGQLTETGAFTGEDYVEMPKERGGRLFGRLLGKGPKKGKAKRRHGSEPEKSAHEWLDVEEDYDARAKGEELGAWSSQNSYEGDFEGYDGAGDDVIVEEEEDAFFESGFKPRSWDGGVFSRESLEKVRSKVRRGDSEAEAVDVVEEEAVEAPADGEAAPRRARRNRHGGGVDALFGGAPAEEAEERPHRRAAAQPAQEQEAAFEPAPRQAAATVTGELEDLPLDDVQAVHDFRLPNIDMEVWFVALGAELAGNSGMKEFLATHRDELKGAIFIDLEALGVGDLTLVGSEGTYFPVKPSSRMARYVRKAASALGVRVGESSMLWRNSASTVALRHGSQAMHLACMAGDKPAYAASKEDVMGNLSEEELLANADFVVEVLKGI